MKPRDRERNKPTYSQIETIYRWISWQMPTQEARDAVAWLRDHATRQEASAEVKRMYTLYYAHTLTYEECFNAEVWRRYKREKEAKKE